MKSFVQLVAKRFTVSLLSTRIGLVTTEVTSNPKLRFRSRNPFKMISETLDRWVLNALRQRKLSSALKMSLSQLFNVNIGARSVPRVLLVITDRSTVVEREAREICTALQRLKNAGVNVFVVGAGSNVDKMWINKLVAKPNVFTSESYGELGLHSAKITSSVCKVGGKINLNHGGKTTAKKQAVTYNRYKVYD